MNNALEKLISDLKEEELIILNKIVVERISQIRREKNLVCAQQFKIGDFVSFDDQGSKRRGVILKINSKSISILTSQNERWNVSPALLNHDLNPTNNFKD